MPRFYKIVSTPVGPLKLVASDKGLTAILWENDDPKRVRVGALEERPDHPVLLQAERQLGEYFAGKRTKFDLDLDFVGTEFQKRVWAVLLAVPFGQTKTYGQIARELGKPSAARAVGAANGRNPLSIVTPCHRVVGSNGDLTGFAGGRSSKRYLLALEGVNVEGASARN